MSAMTSIPNKLFVNIYAPFAGQIGTAYATGELADQMAAHSRLACIEIRLCGSAVTGIVRTGDTLTEGALAVK